ncbi:MAG: class F sortase [bacterium]
MLQSFSSKTLESMMKHKLITIVAFVIIVAAGTYIIVRQPKPNLAAVNKGEVITVSTDKPSEEEPVKVGYVWKGEASDPKKIVIPSIGVDGFIQKVGVDQNKQVGVPTNIYLTGWFVDSVKPGEKGLSIIDGHLDGYQKDGVFKKLSQLKPGDEFTVEKGDGALLKYSVLTNKSVATEKAAAELFSQDPSVVSQLNLITCGGQFDESARSYKERVITTAELIN